MTTNTVSRSLHDVGLAAWFGGTLANAVALNAAAGQAADQASTGRVVNAGWDRWTPVNGAAIGAYLAGSAVQLGGNAERIKLQEGVATMSSSRRPSPLPRSPSRRTAGCWAARSPRTATCRWSRAPSPASPPLRTSPRRRGS